MQTVGQGTPAALGPLGQGTDKRPGHSGEGARSALEQLIQQERRRDAQLPREDASDDATRAAPQRA
jgi:hypothetical protein